MSSDRMLREEAARHLTALLGVKVSKAMLEKWASLARGPSFSLVLGKAVYSRCALDQWAAAQLSDETPASKRHRKAG
jgi:hypothetical protein